MISKGPNFYLGKRTKSIDATKRARFSFDMLYNTKNIIMLFYIYKKMLVYFCIIC